MNVRPLPTSAPWRLVLACGALMFTFLATTVASAQSGSCETDADCAEGQACEVVASGGCACPPCQEGGACPDCQCDETTWSECITPPIACANDGECPQYLSCISGGDAPCAVACDANGDCTEDCPTPDPTEGGICDFVPSDCQADGDCPEGFACEQWGNSTCDVTCEPNGACTESCGDPAPTSGSCIPQQMDCTADADCPASWVCYAFVSESCSGGGSNGCVCPDCAPDEECGACDCPDVQPDPDPVECTEETNHWCIPAGWEQWVDNYTSGGGSVSAEDSANGDPRSPFGGDGNDDGASPTANNDNNDDGGSSSSGCSVASPGAPVGSAGLVLLGLLGVALVSRRR